MFCIHNECYTIDITAFLLIHVHIGLQQSLISDSTQLCLLLLKNVKKKDVTCRLNYTIGFNLFYPGLACRLALATWNFFLYLLSHWHVVNLVPIEITNVVNY